MTLARRIMNELHTYADFEVGAFEVDQAWQEFQARVEKRSASRRRIRRVAVVGVAAALVMAVVVVTQGLPSMENPPAPPADNGEILLPKDRSYYIDLATNETTPIAESLVPRRFVPAGSDLPRPLYSPDGSRLAFNVNMDTCREGSCSRQTRLVVEDADGSGATMFPNRDPHPLAWSPDGTQLLYQGTSPDDPCSSCAIGNLYLLDLESRATTQITDFHVSNAWWWQLHADFSPDGQTVVFDLPRSPDYDTAFDVWSVPRDGGEPSLVLRDAAMPKYLPDGERLVFLEARRGFTGDVISIAGPGGDRRTLVDTTGTWSLALSPERTQLLYQTDGAVHVVDIATRHDRQLQTGYRDTAWVSEDKLIVVP